jgi:protein TonB
MAEYPPSAKSEHIEGDVVVEITINEEGNVISARAINGPDQLKEAALSAAKRWKFKPVVLNNKPIKVSGVLTFRFKLDKPAL